MPATDPAAGLVAQAESLRLQRRLAEALDCLDRAVRLQPAADHLRARAFVLRELGRPAEALADCDAAVRQAPSDPFAHTARGIALWDLGRLDEALAAHDHALALHPGLAWTLNARAAVLRELGLVHAALCSLRQAVAAAPEDSEARGNLALLLLLLGAFEEGWRAYESRWQRPGFRMPLAQDAARRWQGDAPVAGRTVLLHCEQGLGDTLQFSRFGQLLAARGARVVLVVQPPLRRLLAALPWAAQVVARGEPLPAYDLWCPLLSLPLALRVGGAIPWNGPTVAAPAASLEAWRARLPSTPAPRIALVWRGNPRYARDHRRSLPLAALLAALPPGPQYISLQRELRPGDAEVLRQRPDVVHLGDALDDFTDTAALCALSDLVISVDTSVAHLAGALGRPLWVLLPFDPDWRWMLGRDDSPWYPSARLLRQPRPLDWDGLLAQLRVRIASAVARGHFDDTAALAAPPMS